MADKVQFRGDTAANWTAVNPILSSREPAFETDTGLYKLGDGVNHWNDLPYAGSGVGAQVVALNGQAVIPPAPAAGALKLFAKLLGGRMFLRQIGPSGLSSPLQPSFFQNQIIMINTSGTTGIGTFGNTVTSVGTISHPTPSEIYGLMANIATAGTAAATAGTGNNLTPWCRGTIAGGSNGFFMFQRLAFPDAAYASSGAGVGSRLFAGLTNTSFAAAVASDDVAAHHFCAFQYYNTDTGRQDTTWKFATKDGTTVKVIDTGLPFNPQHVYDFYIFCPSLSSTIYYRIDDVTAGTSSGEQSTQGNLPGAGTMMRMGLQVFSEDAVIRNIRMNRVYGESDR